MLAKLLFILATVVFTPDDGLEAEAQYAAAAWNKACPGMMAVGPGGVRIEYVDWKPKDRPLIIGAWYKGENLIRLHATPANLFLETMAHEMGHAAGLDHYGAGVMRPQLEPGWNGHVKFDDVVAAAAAGWKCQNVSLSTDGRSTSANRVFDRDGTAYSFFPNPPGGFPQ